MEFTATCSSGLAPLLADELRALGAGEPRVAQAAVHFHGDAGTAMAACLWSRTASRILQPLATLPPTDADGIHAAALRIDWPELFEVTRSFAVDVAGSHRAIANTHHAALRVKDAIADRFRAEQGARPNVARRDPDLRVHLHLGRDRFVLCLDWSGEALHKRGWRLDGGRAPIRETLAAGMLLFAGWPERAAEGWWLADPMCGAGTLLIEAAAIACDIAPGLNRGFAFEHLRRLPQEDWARLRAEARARRRTPQGLRIVGSDADRQAIARARRNAERAGLGDAITLEHADFTALARPDGPGLVVCNPPWGERLGNEPELIKLYSLLGARLRTAFGGSELALITPRTDLSPRLGLRARSTLRVRSGPLDASVLLCPVPEQAVPDADHASDFGNRLEKNLRRLARWRRRVGVDSFRAYDADLPEFAIAVDVYQCEDGTHLFVQEYAPPRSVDPVRAEKRLRAALDLLARRFAVPAGHIHLRRRLRRARGMQYQPLDPAAPARCITEHGMRVLVKLDSYQDTGIFLDHRGVRRRIAELAPGGRFLNLFCYTATASVRAALAGARQTVSVDLSNTYLEWAQHNFAANGLSARRADRMPLPLRGNVLVRADCTSWLATAAADPALRFDLILLDPPSFSNSARMEGHFDVQRDHARLIREAVALLAPGGLLLFSTNRRGFSLDTAALADLYISETTRRTVDPDFNRPRPPHRSFEIRTLADAAPVRVESAATDEGA